MFKMDQEELSIFATIKGIGSASGLFLKQNFLYVIGDNSAYLYEYDIDSKIVNNIQLLKDLPVLENIPKAVKPDFEVLCQYQNTLYILGSGSTANRNLMLKFDLQTKQISQHNLSSLYAKIKQQCKIDDENLNIEGAVFNGDNWFLFNRGNGNAQKNGIIKINTVFHTQKRQCLFWLTCSITFFIFGTTGFMLQSLTDTDAYISSGGKTALA